MGSGCKLPESYWKPLLDPGHEEEESLGLEQQVCHNLRLRDIFAVHAAEESRSEYVPSDCQFLFEPSPTDGVTTPTLVQRCGQFLQRLCDEFCRLQRAGFAADYYSMIVENPSHVDVLQVIRIHLSTVLTCARALKEPQLAPTQVRDQAVTLLRLLGLDPSSLIQPPIEDLLGFSCAILALGLASYTGSHCCDFSTPIWKKAITIFEFFNVDKLRALCGMAFSQQQLACLDEFVGGPVWALVRSASEANRKQYRLSINLADFADLWGPIWAVPTPDGSQLQAVHTERGLLYRVWDPNSEQNSTKPELTFHWIRIQHPSSSAAWSPQACNLHNSQAPSMTPAQEDLPPTTFLPFPSDAQLLVGASLADDMSFNQVWDSSHCQRIPQHTAPQQKGYGIRSKLQNGLPLHSTTPTARSRSGEPHDTRQMGLAQQPATATARSLGRSPRLRRNNDCTIDFRVLNGELNGVLEFAGVQDEVYRSESYQVGIQGGKLLTGNANKSWKRQPARTWKSMVVHHSSMGLPLLPVLNLHLGLQISTCTGNAQRVTLWQALKIAFMSRDIEGNRVTKNEFCKHSIGDPRCIQQCWGLPLSQEDLRTVKAIVEHDGSRPSWEDFLRNVIPARLDLLQRTGFGDDGTLRAWWPFTASPRTVRMSEAFKKWKPLLEDTPRSAVFAAMSSQCLNYKGTDQVSADARRIVEAICDNSDSSPVSPVLLTVISLNPEVIDKGRYWEGNSTILGRKRIVPYPEENFRFRTTALLQIRNDGSPGQLAIFLDSDEVIFHSRDLLRSRHEELTDMQCVGPHLMSVCVGTFPTKCLLSRGRYLVRH